MNLRVQVLDAEAISRLTGGVDQFSPQVVKAKKRTMRKLIKFADSQVRKKLAFETGIPQRAFKGRVVTSIEPDGSEGVMWVGAYSLSPYSISPNVLQTKVGIKAGRKVFTGAFRPYVLNTENIASWQDKSVWIRANHPAMALEPKWAAYRTFGSGPGFPVHPVRWPIVEEAEEAFEISSQAIEDRFETIFRQQLTYALEVEGK